MIGGHRFLVSPLTSFGNRARFGLEPLHALVGLRQRRAGRFQFCPRGDVAGFVGLRCGFGRRQRFLRGLHGACERVYVAEIAGFLREFGFLSLDVGDFLIEPGQPVAMGAHAGLELVALGGEVGQHRGQFSEQPLGGGQRRFGFRDAFIDAAALLDARLDLFLDFGIFGVEPRQCYFGIRSLLLRTGVDSNCFSSRDPVR